MAVGHARDGVSLKLQEYFGATVAERFDNWYGEGECYSLYTQKLSRKWTPKEADEAFSHKLDQ